MRVLWPRDSQRSGGDRRSGGDSASLEGGGTSRQSATSGLKYSSAYLKTRRRCVDIRLAHLKNETRSVV